MSRELTKYEEKWAAEAERYAAEETVSGRLTVSTRGGVLAIQDEPMPGNQICVIVLDAIRENTYYPDAFDPDDPQPPKCFAFGRTDKEMEPHEAVDEHDYFERQAQTCSECWAAEWGSADRGAGKACKNRRRLALIPAGVYEKKKGSRDTELHLFDDPEHFEEADIAFLKLPVTSVKEWAKFVKKIASAHQRPPSGVITNIYIEPHPNYQYQVKFELIDEVPDELADIVMARMAEAEDAAIQPYQPPQDDDRPSARKGIAGVRKKRKRDDG